MRKYLSTILYLADFFYLAGVLGYSLVLVGYLCSLCVSEVAFANTVTANQYFFLDFSKYYAFAKMTFSPDNLQIFDPAVQWKWEQIVVAPAKITLPFYSEYPPFLGALFAPLMMVPLRVAYLIWLAVSAGSACGVIYYLARKYGGQGRLSSFGCAVGVFASVNALWATLLGQLNWLMVTCAGILYIGLSLRKPIINGLSLAVMSLKPQYAVFFASTCANRLGWKSMAAFVVAELALTAIGGFTVGWANVFGYPDVVLHSHGSGTVGGTSLQHYEQDQQFLIGVRRLLTLLFGAFPLSISLFIMFAAMIALAVLWQKVQNETMRRWAMAATILTFLIVNPHCHLHDCVITGVAAALTMPTVSLRGMQAIQDRVHRIWCITMYLYPFVAWVCFAATFQQSLLRTIFFLAVNLFLVALALMMLHRLRRNDLNGQSQPAEVLGNG
jgi:hypothetical protein